MGAHEGGALAVAEALERHPAVTSVMYPGLSSHPQHDLARAQMANFSGMMTFQVEDGDALGAADDEAAPGRALRGIARAPSHPGLLAPHGCLDGAAPTGSRAPPLAGYRAYAGDGVFRLSVGLEDPADIIDDLYAVL